MPPDNRELVFCHSCEDEWYRDQHGLVCPNPECGSDVVEIVCLTIANIIHAYNGQIDPESDPRHQDTEPESEQHPLHDHDPWNANPPDPDEADISQTPFQSSTHDSGRNAPPPHPFESLFGSILGGGMNSPGSFPGSFPGSTADGNPNQNTRGAGNTWSSSQSYTFTMSSSPTGVRITRTTGFPPSTAPGDPNDDLTGILRNMLQFMGPPPNARNEAGTQPGMPTFNPIMNILMGGLGGLPGSHGDVAYTQEGFDRILTMLREQHGGSDGPPPATAEAIAALPKIKISKEHLDEQNKAECSICMDQASIGDEVTMLPCNHWFHGDCIKSWLIEHDTCPQCRRGITPKDGDRNQPRTTGQAPRNWNLSEGDLENMLSRESSNTDGTAGSASRDQGSSSRGSSTRGSVVASVASNIMRRLGGGGSSSSAANNSDRHGPNRGESRS